MKQMTDEQRKEFEMWLVKTQSLSSDDSQKIIGAGPPALIQKKTKLIRSNND